MVHIQMCNNFVFAGAWSSLRLHILTRNMSEKKEKSRSIFDFFKEKKRSCSDIEMTDLSSSMALKDPDPTGHNIATTAAGKSDITSSTSADTPTPLAVEPKDRPSGSISDSPVVCSGHTPLPDEPHQPHDVTFMLPQTVKMGGRAGNKTKTLTFQRQWCNEFPWIHCDTNLNKVLCYTCCKAVQNKLLNESYHRSEGAFLVDGFSSWKRARDAFKSHEKSEIHRSAREILLNLSKKDIISQLDDHHHSDQENARDALIKIVTSIRYLASEGSALRGKEHDSGKFKKLLRLRSEDDRNLAAWLGRKHNYTHSDIVNEILEIMGHDIVRDIVEKVNKESIQFGIICDGTQDISGKEQEAICIRYITSNFQICEDFIGLYNQGDTTGAGLAKMLQDVLLRVQLPVANLRAQTYDGAGNMAGEYNGCQANIKRVQPLCIYTHCGAHVSHLVTSKSIEKSVTMRDALDCVQELGKFSNQSGKFRELYSNLRSEETMQSPTSLKPICPTRWLTRAPAVISVLSNYAAALTALKKAADMFGSTSGARASGLYNNLMSTKTLVGLKMALPILQVMESFNKSLQGKNQTVAGMLVVVESLKRELQSLRSEDTFHKIFVEAEEMAESLSLEELSLPRVRKIPMRIEGGVATHNFNTVEEYYRPQCFQVLDAALANLDAYFTSTDLTEYGKLTDMLVTGVYNAVVSERYPELTADLEQELAFFHRNFTVTHISDLQDEFESMTPEARRMFQQVERLLRIILVNPASSCTAERSFSSLRRLKTWLRSTMTQSRLNHLMLCNVHSDLLEKMDSQIIAEKFISNKPDARRKVFGCFK